MEINKFYSGNDSIKPSEPIQMTWQNYDVIADASSIARFSYRQQVIRNQNAIITETSYLDEIGEIAATIWNNPNRHKTYLEHAMEDAHAAATTAWHNWKSFPNF